MKQIFVIILSFLLIIVVFSLFAQEKAVEEKKPELKYGKVTIEDLLAGSPDWVIKAKDYNPKPDAISYLSEVAVPVKIELYYGHWCGDSVNNVPKFLKIMELAANPALEIEYWSVERVKKGEKRGPVNNRELKAIPTFIIFIDGKEAGAIIENPSVSIEEDLVAILQKGINP